MLERGGSVLVYWPGRSADVRGVGEQLVLAQVVEVRRNSEVGEGVFLSIQRDGTPSTVADHFI